MPTDTLRTLWLTERARLLVLFGLFAMVTLNQAGSGVLNAVIPVKLAADGYTAAAAGLVTTVFSIFFLIGCVIGPQIVRAIGPERTPLAIAVLHTVLALLHWAFPGPLTWTAFRGVGGLATATYFLLVESWIFSHAPATARGLVFGIYMVMNRMAFAFGQMVIAFIEPNSILNLFFVSAAAFALSPLLMPRLSAPTPSMTPPSLSDFLELPRFAPAAAAACLMHGLVFGSVPGLLPKWGVDQGISIAAIGTALAAMQFGGLFMQLPISYASDRFERRTVMATATFGTAIASLIILVLPAGSKGLWFATMFVWGGFASTLYSLAAAHAGDLAPADRRVAWVSSLLLIWGTGAAVGPLIASLLMDVKGSAMLWSYAAAVSAAVGLFLMWRKLVRP